MKLNVNMVNKYDQEQTMTINREEEITNKEFRDICAWLLKTFRPKQLLVTSNFYMYELPTNP